ncbi:MAG: CBS domain-containing protein [Deltaproteobacteria bacterium]|nr:CBS domain-containing protein [Deltaproteobacteria bacterium]
MDIIVTHRNSDFDALAGQVAASKLYPGAIKVSAGMLSPMVKSFLALHKDHFELTPVKEIDQAAVTRMIVVDVRRAGRLRDYAPLLKRIAGKDPCLEVHIYDHHEGAPDDLTGQLVQVEPVGAATTLLVEKLRERGLKITPIEATVLALGIYADTGSLTFRNTTPRDAEAATYLLRHGASLPTLRYFLHAPLGSAQRKILASLLTQSKMIQFMGIKIAVRTVALDKKISGLSEIVNEALMLEGYEAIFAFFPRKETVTIIGRSWVPSIDVGAILAELGGGGHNDAGSATMKKTTLGRAKARLMAVLNANPPRPHRVRLMMSTPVRTLSPEQILDHVADDFATRRISGAPVVKDGALVGMISKRDIRRAKRDGRSHLALSSCMIHEVKTIGPDDPVLRAFEMMISEDIGRLPVIEDGHIVGIVTRNDLLTSLYPNKR